MDLLICNFRLIFLFQVEKYEELCAVIETELSRILDGTYYDTVRNYIEFYQAWKASGIKNLESFFRSYKVSVNRRHQSCVSLAMETIARLIAIIPMLRDYMYVASCEEAVENVQEYLESSDLDADEENLYSFEKEHCLAAMKIRVQGRDGVMLLDLGYHVGRPVTVMDDNIYPHTGWFVQADEPHCKREFSYNYVPNGPHLVRWTEKITRGEKIEIIKSLIYVKRPFATAVDVANRRNLVYNFRSIMARDPKGRLCAGFFFPVRMDNDQQLTLFYDGPNKISVRVKQKFSIFKDPENVIDFYSIYQVFNY